MEELIFFAVIIFFSILESIARSRKAKQGGGEVEERSGAEGREAGARTADRESRGSGRSRMEGERLPTYDQDPSYDDLATGDFGRPLEPYTARQGSDDATTSKERRPSSETMLPGDLLEQLEGLARGRQAERGRQQAGQPSEEARRREAARRRREDEERRKKEIQARLEDAEARRQQARRDLPAEVAPLPSLERSEVGSGDVWSSGAVGTRAPIGTREHEIHDSHSEYGTDPSSRRPSREGVIDPLAKPMDAQGVSVRRQLLHGGRTALRDAVVVKEVLGPPVALRNDRMSGL